MTSAASEQGGQELDCATCGACCRGDEAWVHLELADDERLQADRLVRLTTLRERGRGFWVRSMNMKDGRCVAYCDDLGDGRKGCSIYELRPTVCREFEVGSQHCRAARQRFGIEPAARPAEPPPPQTTIASRAAGR